MVHKFKISPHFVLLALLLLGGTYFGFLDDQFRGWDDTHQYQLEAQAWSRGSRPPVAEIIDNAASHVGPTHVPPLVPYSWSIFSINGDVHASLYRIRILQAVLLFLSFLGLAWALRRKSLTPDLIAISVLVFFNEFSRQLVMVPISEPFAIALLIAGYVWPRTSGVAAALEIMVRPPLILFFAPQLWRMRKSRPVIGGAVVTLGAGALFFRGLLVPSAFRGGGLSAANAWAVIHGFVSDSAFQLFNHLLPVRNPFFISVWGVFLGLVVIAIFLKKRAAWMTWLAGLIYLFVILIPWNQGIRYFFPLILFLILEFRPVIPRKAYIVLPLAVLLLHLSIRQAESYLEFKRYPVPETDSPGLQAARSWLAQQHFEKDRLMMGRFRYCINFFQTGCYGFNYSSPQDAVAEIRRRKIHFVVFTGIGWQKEELAFEERLKKALADRNYPVEKMSRYFANVRLLDVSHL